MSATCIDGPGLNDGNPPRGCYFRQERIWRTVAASSEDESGNEVVTPADAAKIGMHELDREWRFEHKTDAELWASAIEAEAPTPIADCPHNRNGWVVCERRMLGDPANWSPAFHTLMESQRQSAQVA